ncbi:MAG: YraN family protein [Saprospiraceae bacterium]|nr:YraN family protein [Saprospiraceae bacterium]
MAKHNEVGQTGEAIAADFLQQKGYTIIATNWRYQYAEIDIICQLQDLIVFVEVKTQTHQKQSYPEEAVNDKKIQKLGEAAEEFLHQHEQQGEFRFDIIAVTLQPQTIITHFEDAFFPH